MDTSKGVPTFYLAKFSQKLHENEENLTKGGVKILLGRSVTVVVIFFDARKGVKVSKIVQRDESRESNIMMTNIVLCFAGRCVRSG